MARDTTRRAVLTGVAATAAALAGCSAGGGADGSGSSGGSEAAGWQETELTDVLSGDAFTVAGLSGPVVLETFAVWCPVCTRQQEMLGTVTERAGDDVSVVSLNTDPNEDAEAVRGHAEENGFDWRYAVAPAAMTEALVDEFGPSITNAPSAPVAVVCPDGSTTYLDERGVKAADTILSTVDTC